MKKIICGVAIAVATTLSLAGRSTIPIIPSLYDFGQSRPPGERRGVLFVLADGMEGHARGDLASKMACQGSTRIFDDGTVISIHMSAHEPNEK